MKFLYYHTDRINERCKDLNPCFKWNKITHLIRYFITQKWHFYLNSPVTIPKLQVKQIRQTMIFFKRKFFHKAKVSFLGLLPNFHFDLNKWTSADSFAFQVTLIPIIIRKTGPMIQMLINMDFLVRLRPAQVDLWFWVSENDIRRHF